ncbi:acetate/propionate family kinase [Pararhodonellum marinum]|uniref:acetate/propionate family kinase n=1 Tax=Pararhodonellum marinum TaxID=2755358 RepID=UPI0018904BBD|nr:acetate kinase [Pararhodonellum marinum]
MKILVLNSGSSSLKYQLFDLPEEAPLCSGMVDRIGLEKSSLVHKTYLDTGEKKHQSEQAIPDHKAALLVVTELLLDPEKGVLNTRGEVMAIGHRVVHGGEEFSVTTLINDAVKQKIQDLTTLAPLHNPPNLLGINEAQRIFPEAKQVAVFDTAFHQSMPQKAYRFAIPQHLYANLGIRAYGFHGTSHQYVSRIAGKYLDNPKAKMITIHLGNGCSMTAVQSGKSIDHSMGLGPLGGLVMGTRCGDLDPSIIFHLIQERGFSAKEVNELLNKKSGLQGLCGHSDMRDVKKAMAQGDAAAKLAYELYAYRIKKYIGAYTAVMNGLDALVFTAGVGENDADMRALVCEDMDFYGLELDPEKNKVSNAQVREVNHIDSKTKILVIPTNEELEIGRQVYELVSRNQRA